ncbi:lipocalin-like domain-containing protein [Vibrio vulnificus]|uniref:lipocalin-like domain-containing protein n=1 Tax=Vibrio vulnificus TaxID=672 RepID=UPI001A336115|nr:lipocalin-like domain-containing protein [Vibrio vulnificus]MDS1844340.1 lipocalin-like domain-containing protein [Vibrio vulnificus]HAS8284034.1 carotenoid 1,2-hydratase [Vibrio vulnificus]
MKWLAGKSNNLALMLTFLLAAMVTAAMGFYWSQSATNEAQEYRLNNSLGIQDKTIFEPVLPNKKVSLPEDFKFHEQYQHEWWHYFATLQDEFGKFYTVQFSLFRIATDEREVSGWQNPQLYLANVVLTGKEKIWREQRVARGGIGQAGSTNKPFRMWIDNWTWRSLGTTPFPGSLTIATDDFSLELATRTGGPFVLNGDKGYQVKHDLESVASFSISAPFLDVKGSMFLEGRRIEVTGNAWLQKEWGSNLFEEGQQGWDWFTFNLDNDKALSISRYRHQSRVPYIFGTLSTSSGKVIPLTEKDVTVYPILYTTLSDGKRIPLQWAIEIPSQDIYVQTKAVQQEMWLPFLIPYWEGPINVAGSKSGRGFMQLTGY